MQAQLIMETQKHSVVAFIIILVLSCPYIGRGYLPEGKILYLHSQLSTPLQMEISALSEVWRVVFSRVNYVYAIYSEEHGTMQPKTQNTYMNATSFAPCGRVQVHCWPPSVYIYSFVPMGDFHGSTFDQATTGQAREALG